MESFVFSNQMIMQNEEIKNNLIVNLTFEFSILIIRYCEQMEMRKKFILSNQILKSGTSIGANVWEAQNAESKNDFIHKFKIAAKEIDETEYWLCLCQAAKTYPNPDPQLLENLQVIARVVGKIISSSKRRQNPSAHSQIS